MRRLAAGVLAMSAVALASGCGEELPPAVSAPPVVVAVVEARDLEIRIEASGELIPRQHAFVSAEVAGRITEIVRDEGRDVVQGDVVVTIDPERRSLEMADARASLAQAEASAAEAKREQARIKRLYDEGVASQARLEQVETQLDLAGSRHDAARARVGMARRALSDAEVRAPFDGVIASRSISVGEFVQPGTRLFEMVALDPIDVEFHLPEADASRVALGQEVAVQVEPWPREVFPAKVRFIGPTIDPQSHTLLVRAALDNGERRLRPGLFASVDLGVARREQVPMVLEEAVLQRADGEVVFRLGADQRVERLAIRTGEHLDGLVEVVEGLATGDSIVVSGHYALADGVRVRPTSPEGAPASDLAGRAEGMTTP